MLAMTLYPQIQAKAREELDAVIGDRLPTVADMASTPYLNAVIQETLRWHPIAPNGKSDSSRWFWSMIATESVIHQECRID